MQGNVARTILRPVRRWTCLHSRRAVLLASAVTVLALASAPPVAAVARPVPGGVDDLFGRDDDWSGWSIGPQQSSVESQADREPPLIRLWVDYPGPYEVGSIVTLDFACTDRGVGLQTCPAQTTLDTSTAGSRRIWYEAVDAVGNVAWEKVDYTVVGTQPVSSPQTPMMIFPDHPAFLA